MSHQGDKAKQSELLVQQRFLPYFTTQFLGAFNDNVFKNALIIMIAYQGAQFSSVNTDVLTNLAAGLFILPFFLFSATAGQWIEKNEKSRSMRLIKMLEIIIMLCAAAAFYYEQLYILIVLLFFMGTQSTFFGPVKYSYIPQHLADHELVAGNALVQMGTFVAILIGTMIGGILIAQHAGQFFVAITLVTLAVCGYITSLFIPDTPSPNPELIINWNPITETWRNISFIRSNRTVFLSVLGISWFWFLGATYLVQLPNYTRTTLVGDEQVVTLLLSLFTIGIGSGSLLCNWLSSGRVELGLVPFGSIGLTIFGVDLFFAQPEVISNELMSASAFLQSAGSFRILTDVLLIGIFGGLYIVPLFALVQERTDPEHLSRVIAGNNIFNALLMVLSAVFAIIMLSAGASIAHLFLVIAIFNAVVALYIYTLVPEFLMRFLVWLLIHSIYRVRKQGLGNIPDNGPAVIVCNHVSYVDAMIIGGCVHRPVRFVMNHKIFKIPVLSFVFKTARAIPIAGRKDDPVLMERAFADIKSALEQGDVVCIFPEGKLTLDGNMNMFRPGIERIIKTTPVPVIPARLTGLWGSLFSMDRSNVVKRLLRGFRSSVGLRFGSPLQPDGVTAELLQEKVKQLAPDN